jgi:hypothetical protein
VRKTEKVDVDFRIIRLLRAHGPDFHMGVIKRLAHPKKTEKVNVDFRFFWAVSTVWMV